MRKYAFLGRLKHIEECGHRANTIARILDMCDSPEDMKETLIEMGFKLKKYECPLAVGSRVFYVWSRCDENLSMVDEIDVAKGIVHTRYTLTAYTDAISLIHHSVRGMLTGTI